MIDSIVHVLCFLCLLHDELFYLSESAFDLLKEKSRRSVSALSEMIDSLAKLIHVSRFLHWNAKSLTLRSYERDSFLSVFTSLDQRSESQSEHLFILIKVDEMHAFVHPHLVHDLPSIVFWNRYLIESHILRSKNAHLY